MGPAWFISAYELDFDASVLHGEDVFNQVAWAENAEGFDVQQMSMTTVRLPTIPGMQVPVAFGFQTSDRYEKLIQLYVHFPRNYIPLCDTMLKLTLPGVPTCEIVPPGKDEELA